MRFPCFTALLAGCIVIGSVALSVPPASAQISDGKIKIGVLDDFSGQYCVGNCMGPVEASRIAAEEFGNSINGAPIEIIWGDHQNKPDAAVSIVNKWFDLEQVDAVADITNSSVALAATRIARDKGKAVLLSSAGSPDFTGKECAPYSTQWTFRYLSVRQEHRRSRAAVGQDLVHHYRRLPVRQNA